jgi:hypothetical protein
MNIKRVLFFSLFIFCVQIKNFGMVKPLKKKLYIEGLEHFQRGLNTKLYPGGLFTINLSLEDFDILIYMQKKQAIEKLIQDKYIDPKVYITDLKMQMDIFEVCKEYKIRLNNRDVFKYL